MAAEEPMRDLQSAAEDMVAMAEMLKEPEPRTEEVASPYKVCLDVHSLLSRWRRQHISNIHLCF